MSLSDWLWCVWRDLTWGRPVRREYLQKMERYRVKNQKYAERRVRDVLDGCPTDWDDNVAEEWAHVLAKRWGMK